MTEDAAGSHRYDERPSALIFADSDAGRAAAAQAVDAIGGRVVAQLGLEEAVDRLNRQAAIDAVIVDLTSDHGALSDRLLDLLSYIAARDNRPVVVAAPFSILDCVMARLRPGPITLLCEPDPIDRVSALAVACGLQTPSGVKDISADADNARLRRIAREVDRIGRTLVKLSNDRPSGQSDSIGRRFGIADIQPGIAADSSDFDPANLPSAEEVRVILRRRRLRNRYFDASLFADPAWDMLLDLLAARLADEQVSVTSLCVAAAVPSTTALRWIMNMTDLGLFERRADPADGRRAYISLSDAATNAMAGYFAAARQQGGMIL